MKQGKEKLIIMAVAVVLLIVVFVRLRNTGVLSQDTTAVQNMQNVTADAEVTTAAGDEEVLSEAEEETSPAEEEEVPDEAEEEVPPAEEEEIPDEAEDEITAVDEEDPSAGSAEEPALEEKEKLRFRNKKLLYQHYEKHGIDMGFSSADEYEKAASEVATNPDALHKIEAEDGDDVYYVEATNEFVVVSTDGFIRTYFLPDSGIKYFNKQ